MRSASLCLALLSVTLLSATAVCDSAAMSRRTDQIAETSLHPKLPVNPTPHVYQSGDRITSAYGPFTEVADWKARGLLPPADGHRWVHYGDTYLLIESESQLIITITRASLPEGRA